MDIMLFGVQGAWKWTQWKLLAQTFWLKYFETWERLRNLGNSPLWIKVQEILKRGEHVDTTTVIDIVENFINSISPNDRIVFDWIPRNIEQLHLFERLLTNKNRQAIGINFLLSKEVAVERLSRRFNCVWVDMTSNPLMTEAECIRLWWKVVKRNDDNKESIEKRISLFFQETNKVIDYYLKEWRMFEVNWNQDVDAVKEDFINLLYKQNIIKKWN